MSNGRRSYEKYPECPMCERDSPAITYVFVEMPRGFPSYGLLHCICWSCKYEWDMETKKDSEVKE